MQPSAQGGSCRSWHPIFFGFPTARLPTPQNGFAFPFGSPLGYQLQKGETEPTSGLCATSPAWSPKRETSCRATAGWMRTASAPPARKPGRPRHETDREEGAAKWSVCFRRICPPPKKGVQVHEQKGSRSVFPAPREIHAEL